MMGPLSRHFTLGVESVSLSMDFFFVCTKGVIRIHTLKVVFPDGWGRPGM